MPYDLFVSYSRGDNRSGRVTELIQRIEADYRGFAGEELHCFFDVTEIRVMDDWQDRILGALSESNLLLLILSPAYLDSLYCEWEIVEFLKYEHSRAVQGQGVAPIYFVEIPGLDSPGFGERAATWLAQVRRRNHCDLRPWFDEGAAALERAEVRARLEDLERSLHARLTRLRRITSAPGNVPAYNPRFVGRKTEMQLLHRATGRGRFGVLTAVHGVGGLGKTALAIQYAYAFADFYPGGRWLVPCAGRQTLAGALRSLDLDLDITFDEEEKRDDLRAAKRVLRELHERAERGAAARAGEANPPSPCALLLLDNVDSPVLLQPPESDLLSGLAWLHVIATTRLGGEQLGADAERHQLLAVDELLAEDALRLIEGYQPAGRFPDDAERTAARGIVALLHGFTLAVEVAAVYLGESRGRITCAAFLERLRAEGIAGLDRAAGGTRGGIPHRQKLLSVTLAPTLQALSAAEGLVLALAASLPPDSVPLPWLRAIAAEDHPELGQDAPPGYDDPWLSLVNRLLGLRLLQVTELADDARTPRVCRMHRVLQELVRDAARSDGFGRRLAAHVQTRCSLLRDNWFDPKGRWEIEPLRALSAQMLARKDEAAPWLANQTVEVLRVLGRYWEAEPLSREALEQLRQALPAGHRDIATSLNNLAGLLRAQGKLSEAEPLYRDALELRRRALPAGHPDIAQSLNNLALLLGAQGKLSEAEPLACEALELRRRALPAGHPDIAQSLNNLALLLRAQGKLSEAEPLAREALEIRRRALPAGHPDIAQSLNSLAVVLQAQGKLSEAEPLFREALQLSRQALPAGHPDIAPSLTGLRSLAFACYLKEDYRGAERVLRGLLEEGFEIPSTHCHLARVLLLMDRAAEARQHVALAWNQISDAPPSIVPRIVFFQLLFALQDGSRTEAGDDEQGPARQIGRLKTALQSENSHAEWNIQAMLDHLAPSLDARSLELLRAIALGLGDRSHLPALDRFPSWRNANPCPLE